jgi:hypothetical protein
MRWAILLMALLVMACGAGPEARSELDQPTPGDGGAAAQRAAQGTAVALGIATALARAPTVTPATGGAGPAPAATPTQLAPTSAAPPTTEPSPTRQPPPTEPPTPSPAAVTPVITAAPSTPLAAVPTAPIAPATKRLERLVNDRGEEYSLEVTLDTVRWFRGSYRKPLPDHIFVVATVTVTNAGPGVARSAGPADFHARAADDALRAGEYIADIADCQLPSRPLQAGESIAGCISFEAPESGRLEIIFMPFDLAPMLSPRWVSFTLR